MNISTKASAVLAIAAISAAFISYSTSANASSLRDSCSGNSLSAVRTCCNTWVRQHGKPMWMLDNGGSCSTAVVCSGGSNGQLKTLTAFVTNPRCYIEQTQPENKSSKTPPRRGT